MTAEQYILAIDEGTTNAKAMLLDESGQMIRMASRPLSVTHPKEGWVEQDGMAIWQAVRTVILELVTVLPTGARIGCVGISNQRESVLIWDRTTGEPLTPVVVWQCQRSAMRCDELCQQGLEQQFIETTGLPLATLFPGIKLSLMLAELPDGYHRARTGELCAGTIDSWLLWNLTGGRVFATDYSNASRTQLFDIYQGRWSPNQLKLLNIPREILPEVRSSAGLFGQVQSLDSALNDVPITAMLGDSHAALFGQGGFKPGMIKATLGTGSSLMAPLSSPVIANKGLTTTIAWHCDQIAYAMEGNINFAGAATSWLAQLCHVEADSALFNAASSLGDNGGVYFVPALSGLSAPYWDTKAKGIICGLNTATSTEHLVRAALEAIAYQIKDVFVAIEQQGKQPLKRLLIDGGPSKNVWLMQFIADLLQRPIQCNSVNDVSAFGVGLMAGIGYGMWSLASLPLASVKGVSYQPSMKQQPLLDEHYQAWQHAVTQARAAVPDAVV